MSQLKRKVLYALVGASFLVAGLLIFLWQGGQLGNRGPDPVAVGKQIMSISLPDLDAQMVPFERWRGKVVVVNFWATWCAPCREEIPEFIKFQQEYGARGLQFVGIAVDSQSRVSPYAREMGINYPVLIGGLEGFDLSRSLGNNKSVLPFTLVLNRDARVVHATVGILKPETLKAVILPML